MALQDEMTFQRIEVLLDMQAKKINAELIKLREELSQVKEDLRKEIHNIKQDSFQQAGSVRTQMWADAPPAQEPQPVPRYAQQQEAPRYTQQEVPRYAQEEQRYAQPGYGGQQRMQEKPPENKPIDRNGVAPSEVSVEKFFYMGNKKK